MEEFDYVAPRALERSDEWLEMNASGKALTFKSS